MLAAAFALRPWSPRRDAWFWIAAAAAVPVLFVLRAALGPGFAPAATAAEVTRFAVIQPPLEELVFRGLIHGGLLRTAWGHGRRLGISAANAVTTLLFCLAHVPAQGALWAGLVLVPSLVFGLLRERSGSVLPPIALHALYNAGFLVALA